MLERKGSKDKKDIVRLRMWYADVRGLSWINDGTKMNG